MFGKSLRNKTVLQFLSTVLNRSDTEYQKSSVSLQGEKRMYNFYSTCILIDGIIKYDILIREERYFNHWYPCAFGKYHSKTTWFKRFGSI